MQRVNCIIVIHPKRDKLLFCLRACEPYTGRYNFVGGKVERGENGRAAAYRELFEETGIGRDAISLTRFMDYVWHPQRLSMQVYAGLLKREVTLVEEKHPLHWLGLNRDFFDQDVFAGEGNIGHMVEILRLSGMIPPHGHGE
jgi:8-oxo-dGTP diphosphatase